MSESEIKDHRRLAAYEGFERMEWKFADDICECGEKETEMCFLSDNR